MEPAAAPEEEEGRKEGDEGTKGRRRCSSLELVMTKRTEGSGKRAARDHCDPTVSTGLCSK